MNADDRVYPASVENLDYGFGITVRDYIAIQAMDSVTALVIAQSMDVSEEEIVKLFYRRSDAMIEQSNK